MTTTGAAVDACQGMDPRIQIPTGNMTAAATHARMAAKTTFSTATAPVGRGASRRSSISLLYENSMTSGRAVLCRPVRTAANATRPGKSTCS